MALTLVTSDLIVGLDYSKLSGTVTTWNQNTTGSAATLTTARNIGGVSFNGSVAINLPGVNTSGNQNTSGTAAGLSATLAVGSGGTGVTSITALKNVLDDETWTFANAATFSGGGVFSNSSQGKVKLIAGSNEYSSLEFANASGTTQWEISKNNTHDLYFYKGGHKMILKAGGNVGIGTTSPGAKLHNYSTATTNVFITGYGTAAQNNWGAQNAFFVKTDNGILISKQNAANNTNRLFNLYNNSSGEAEMYMYRGGNVSYIKLDTNGDSYFNGGNVGIGTTSPSTKLDIRGTSASTNSTLQIVGNGVSTLLLGQNARGGVIRGQGGSNELAFFVGGSGDAAAASGTEVMRISSTGNVSVGAATVGHLGVRGLTNDSSAFSFEAANSSGNSILIVRNDGRVGIGVTSIKAKLDIANPSSSVGAAAAGRLADSSLHLVDTTHDGRYSQITFGYPTNNTHASAYIGYVSTSASASGKGALVFGTKDSTNSNTQPTERMRILSGGNVLIGTTSKLSNYDANFIVRSSASSYACIVSQQDTSTTNNSVIQLNRAETNATTGGYCLIYRQGNTGSGTNRWIVYANGNIQNTNNSYGQLSDIKLKENIEDATPKLNDLLRVNVKNFNFIGDDTKQIGVIAQELEEIFPSMIDESPDTEDREVTDDEGNITNEVIDLGTVTKSVKYSVFTPMLIKAIQEQQTIIEDLKSRIQTLEE